MIPLLFMLTLNQPMSSPQMIRMFGLPVFAMSVLLQSAVSGVALLSRQRRHPPDDPPRDVAAGLAWQADRAGRPPISSSGRGLVGVRRATTLTAEGVSGKHRSGGG